MQKPVKRFRCGPIAASIWQDSRVHNNQVVTFYSISIDKAYKDGEEWKHAKTFAAEDLPKVCIVAEEAYKHLRLTVDQPDGNSTDNK